MDGRGLIALEQPIIGAEWLRSARRARRLASVSLAWLCFEGAATATAGLLAGSTALLGNGLDGAIEGLASVIVVWRFTGSRTLSSSAERRAQRLVAISFFLLAPYIALEATRALLLEHHAETTVLGICLSIASLCICPWLGRAKLRPGEQLGSAATAGEGSKTRPARQHLFGVWKPSTLLRDGTENLIGAMREQRVRRLVCVTPLGAGASRSHCSFVYRELILRVLAADAAGQGSSGASGQDQRSRLGSRSPPALHRRKGARQPSRAA